MADVFRGPAYALPPAVHWHQRNFAAIHAQIPRANILLATQSSDSPFRTAVMLVPRPSAAVYNVANMPTVPNTLLLTTPASTGAATNLLLLGAGGGG